MVHVNPPKGAILACSRRWHVIWSKDRSETSPLSCSLLCRGDILAWRDSKQPLEAMREVALCAKAQVIGDLGNRDAACQQTLRLANTDALKIGVGRDTHFLFKDAEQIKGTQPD